MDHPTDDELIELQIDKEYGYQQRITELKAENASLKAKQSHACHDVDKFYQEEESTDTCRSRVQAVKDAEAEPADPPIIGETCLDLASDCECER